MASAAGRTARGGGRGLLARLRRRLRDRPDSEHEQALTRLVVVPGMFTYMLLAPLSPDGAETALLASLLIFLAGLGVALAVIAHILASPAPNPTRRSLSLLADVAGVAGGMLAGGTVASVFFPLLLWIILGYGFRYGRPYLIAAAAASVAAFSLVLALSPEWRRLPFVDVAFLLALVLLPGYFAVLLAKLTDAVRRAEEASRAKSHFLAAMSHEFRTPLNAVIGMGELLATTRLDADQRDMVGTVRAAAAGLLGLVDDVLDLARLDARRFSVDEAGFDLHDLLATVRHLLHHAAAAKGLHLRLRLAPGTPHRLRGGPRAIRQVLLNLAGNAVKFTERGGVVIEVLALDPPAGAVAGAGAVVEAGPRLRFEVRDTGLGLAPGAQAEVFERFAQAAPTRRKVEGGTGLGLSIARELVELMGGAIGLDSAEGRGSTFWFELPLALDAEAGDEAVDAIAGGSADLGRGEAVVLGGSAAVAVALERLAAAGCRARPAASAAAALELARRHERPAVLLLAGPHPPAAAIDLADALARLGGPEPVDLVTFAADLPPGGLPDATLADLPADAPPAAFRACVRAALRRPAADHSATDRDAAAGTAPAPRRRLDILVAEDNRTNQKVIGRLLEHAGHAARIVADGQAAVEALDDAAFDIVLMDINMPVLDGIGAVKLLRFLHDPADLPPIVALSADATADTEAACRDVGFSGYLTKPVDTRLLLRTLDELAGPVPGRRRQGAPQPPPAPTPLQPLRLEPARPPPSPPFHPTDAAKVIPYPTPEAAVGRAPPGIPAAPRPVLDPAQLAGLARLDAGDGFLAQVIDEFLDDAAGIVARIEAAAAAGDARAFRDEAHALRSSAAYLGATAVFELCLGWRDLDDDALVMRRAAETARLSQEFDRLRAALLAARPAEREAAGVRGG